MIKYIKDIKNWPASTKIFVFLGIISLVGILLRWDHVKGEAQRGFDYFKVQPDSVRTSKGK